MLCAASSGNIDGVRSLLALKANPMVTNRPGEEGGSNFFDYAKKSNWEIRRIAEKLGLKKSVELTGAGRCRRLFFVRP